MQAGGERHQDDRNQRDGEAGDAGGAARRLARMLVVTTRAAAEARVGVVS